MWLILSLGNEKNILQLIPNITTNLYASTKIQLIRDIIENIIVPYTTLDDTI